MKVSKEGGKAIEVTEKAFRVVYAPLGFKAVADEDQEPKGDQEPTDGDSGALTVEQYDELLRNRTNAENKLKELGVEYDETAKADDVKELLKTELAARGLVPDGR